VVLSGGIGGQVTVPQHIDPNASRAPSTIALVRGTTFTIDNSCPSVESFVFARLFAVGGYPLAVATGKVKRELSTVLPSVIWQ
jgi:hypothetical protein